MSNPYSSQDVFDIDLKRTAFIEEKVKLRAKQKALELTVQKESAWIAEKIQTDFNLKEMLQSAKEHKVRLERETETYTTQLEETKETLQTMLQTQKEQEIALAIQKINAKYDTKFLDIPYNAEKSVMNQKRKLDSLDRKYNDLRTKVDIYTKGLETQMSSKKSKALVSAETELAITKERLATLDAETDAINAELERRRPKRFL